MDFETAEERNDHCSVQIPLPGGNGKRKERVLSIQPDVWFGRDQGASLMEEGHDSKTGKTAEAEKHQEKKYAEEGIQNRGRIPADRSGRDFGGSVHHVLQEQPRGKRDRDPVHYFGRDSSCIAF